jgi:hypothetical protein
MVCIIGLSQQGRTVKSVYISISSTTEDLGNHRSAVADALRSLDYVVESMDKYPGARDARPKAACESDVSRSDYYLGIFAHRYGFIPGEDNTEKRSITELEYLAAISNSKPRFIFLSADGSAQPARQAKYEEAEKMIQLRQRLKTERWLGSFESPEDLAKKAVITLVQFESSIRPKAWPQWM